MGKVSRQLNKRGKLRRLSAVWKRTVSAMALIVVFCTVYALVLPAITLSEDPICGQQAHEHSEACYRTQIRILQCAAESHIHGPECEGALGNPTCGFGERILHSHDGRCYDQSQKLICTLPELQEHLHGDACGTTEQKLICTLEALEHTHGEACYENETVLICQETEQLTHTHGAECYQLAEEPSCAQEHEHTQECYDSILICTQEETTGHTHLDSCYKLSQKLVCAEAGENTHSHGEACYETLTNMTCDTEQIADHVHTPSCFDEAGERICGMISGVVHIHDETCFKVVHLDEPELVCSIPEHIHVDACFLDPDALPPVQKDFYCEKGEHEHLEECFDAAGNLICTIPVHKHDVSCKVPDYDPQADLETPAEWAAAFKDLSLTGNWPQDLLKVATTQLGYRESKRNVIWHEDGSVKGYTRYGAWFGAPYVDWSAAFVSFCLEYANISGMPCDTGCDSFGSALETMGLLREPMNYLPKPGDLILLDTNAEDEDAKANRMGIVSELMLNSDGELTTLKVLAGDADGEVKYLTYDLLSSMILGYGELPECESKVLLCDKDHDHTDLCYGRKIYFNDDDLFAQVLISGAADLPEGLTLQVSKVTAASDPSGYSAMVTALSNRMQESPYYMGDASFYQMKLLLNGEPYKLPQEAKTETSVSFRSPVFTPEALEGAAKVETYLLTPQKSNLLSGFVSAELSQSLSSGSGDAADSSDASQTALQNYQVEQAAEDTYENASDGLTGVGFESDTVSDFAVVLSNTTKKGTFWERVFSASEITNGGTYMIISAEGNYALRGDNTNNYTGVTIQAQKGEEYPDAAWDANPERNTRYYTITDTSGSAVTDNNLYWTITASGNQYTVRNQGTSNYLNLSNSVINGQSASLSMTYKLPEQGWRIANSTNYLRNTGAGKFENGSGNDGQYNASNVYYYSRDMLIFKLSDVTDLEIPDDVVHVPTEGGTEMVLVTDASTLSAGDRIIIAAQNYDFALSTTQNSGNRGSAPISKSGSNCTISDATQIITLREGATSGTFAFDVDNKYLYAYVTTYFWNTTSHLGTTSTLDDSASWSISIASDTGVATIKANISNSRSYLRYNSNSSVFCSYASNTNQSVVIYKVIPLGPDKPDYGEFLPVTGSLDGDTALVKDGVTVNGQYFSDPSTSNIETQFRQPSYEASQVIDGKVVTDKSVIYGKDDYGAFQHYPPNTFSVTLSALGQEYEIPFKHQVRTPVDVVFILDVSGSMSSYANASGENADRVIDLCKAVNASIGQIMDDHEANRIGISIYSGGAWELLPLDRYTATNNEFLITNREQFTHGPTGSTFDINHLLGGSTLKNEKGVSFANVGADAVQGIGTYTQAGIAMGNEIFEAIGDDTTYTTTMGEDEYQRTYTVRRQPVFILVSDGEPTYSTSIYNDVLKGPHYGNGSALTNTSNGVPNGKGIHGYYTVLSANYYKRAVSIQYEKEALFFSIGMGIQETADTPKVQNYQTGDNYKRAVLNPEVSVIENLTSNIAKDITVDQLRKMLLSQFTDKTVQVNHKWPEVWYGIPHINEPVLQPNPYADDYSYADGAYFGTLPESELKQIFQDIYQSSTSYTTYGFVLHKNSSVDTFDHIGEGMEIKGDPVLRYAGVNHTPNQKLVDGNVTTYVYEGIYTDPYIPNRYADLSHISVTVTEEADGTQTVEMYIMDQALPTYSPELIGRKYYYEELPVRLIYQVGLTEKAEDQIVQLNQTGGELVFYTNQWADENGHEDQNRISTTVLLPSTENPFYYHIDGTEPPYKPHHSLKSSDTTHTVDYHVDCHRDIEERDGEVLVQVIHKQGNNGKLVFKAETVSIPVQKEWSSGINAEVMNPIEMVVYQVTDTQDSMGAVIRNAVPVATVTLSAQNGWKAVAQGLPAPEADWYYAVAEKVPNGYTASYNRETVRITVDGSTSFDAVPFDGTDTVIKAINTLAVKLPATGGAGTLWYTLGGLLLMAAAILWYSIYQIRRREEKIHP